jgi:hypothetical protein
MTEPLSHYTTDSLNSLYLSYHNHYPLVLLLRQTPKAYFPLPELKTARAHIHAPPLQAATLPKPQIIAKRGE